VTVPLPPPEVQRVSVFPEVENPPVKAQDDVTSCTPVEPVMPPKLASLLLNTVQSAADRTPDVADPAVGILRVSVAPEIEAVQAVALEEVATIDTPVPEIASQETYG
jgi:hypothetical protein